MSFRIRDATAADIPALAALHVQTFNETHRSGRAGNGWRGLHAVLPLCRSN